jgi:uncharacterized protein (TIGR03437 family)
VQVGGLTLVLTDSQGQSMPLLLYYVSPTRINLFVPPNVASGPATLVITNAAARTTALNVTIAPVSPGLLSVDGTGKGQAAGQSTVVNGQLYLTLYGTGFRNAKKISATVDGQSTQLLFAGPQGQFPGLDQINIVLPAATLTPTSPIILTADGITSNPVTKP